MPPFWRQKSGGGAYIFGKFDPEQYTGGEAIFSYYAVLSGATLLSRAGNKYFLVSKQS
jgi:hypothetical protein